MRRRSRSGSSSQAVEHGARRGPRARPASRSLRVGSRRIAPERGLEARRRRCRSAASFTSRAQLGHPLRGGLGAARQILDQLALGSSPPILAFRHPGLKHDQIVAVDHLVPVRIAQKPRKSAAVRWPLIRSSRARRRRPGRARPPRPPGSGRRRDRRRRSRPATRGHPAGSRLARFARAARAPRRRRASSLPRGLSVKAIQCLRDES